MSSTASLAFLHPTSPRKLLQQEFFLETAQMRDILQSQNGIKLFIYYKTGNREAKSKKCRVIDDLDTVDLINEEPASRLTRAPAHPYAGLRRYIQTQ